MSLERPSRAETAVVPLAGRGVLATTARNLARQDWVMMAYHSYIVLRVLLAPHNEFTRDARWMTFALFSMAAITLMLTRGEVLPEGRLRVWIYKVFMFVSFTLTYFALRAVLHCLEPRLLDAKLLSLDEALFGVSPAIWLDRFVTHASVEWFSFFYFSHYFLLAIFLLPTTAFDAGRRRYELLLGIVTVLGIGHAMYTLVPGVGPYAFEGARFAHPFVGGFWWSHVGQAVAGAGAQYDIFPSLHTAVPTFFSLHAIRHRRTSYYRWGWLPTCFFTLNIIVATLFLRWHYAVDVLAGLCLASFVSWFVAHSYHREIEGDERVGRQPVWFV